MDLKTKTICIGRKDRAITDKNAGSNVKVSCPKNATVIAITIHGKRY